MELAYQLWKSQKTEAAKIVFLHGMGGTGSLWRPVAIALEDHFTILAPDQRGHGKSIVPHTPGARVEPSYTPLEYGRDLVETLNSLHFHPTWIVGHSMGVRSACALAHLKRQWIQGLILVDLGFSGVAGGGLGEGLAQFLKKLPVHFDTRSQAREFMNSECPDPSIAQYLLAVSVSDAGGRITFPFDKAALIQTIYAARDSSVRTWVRELGEAGMPILVLRGERSLVWTREEFEAEREQFKDLPSIRFEEVAGAGHGLPFEKRMEFTTRVREWIQEQSQRE